MEQLVTVPATPYRTHTQVCPIFKKENKTKIKELHIIEHTILATNLYIEPNLINDLSTEETVDSMAFSFQMVCTTLTNEQRLVVETHITKGSLSPPPFVSPVMKF